MQSLTPQDTVNLATCDVRCGWAFEKPQSASQDNIQRAQDFLAGRVSLGWTDLDTALSNAVKQTDAQTQVIYVGDGIITTRDADPIAFGKRLKLLWEGKSAGVHAVSVSSRFRPANANAAFARGNPVNVVVKEARPVRKSKSKPL